MKTISTLLTATLFSLLAAAQTAPELIFHNPVLENGTAGQDGAKYRFPAVTTIGSMTFDAIVEIKGRSANDVVVRAIDTTNIGWDKAFQPILGIPNVGANREWWVEFNMEFVKAGTTQKKKIDEFYVTGIDIDGDNGNLNEWTEMDNAKSLSVSSSSSLVTTLLGTVIDILTGGYDDNYRINGPTTNYTNIDTSATAVMATYKYAKKDQIRFKLGGKTNANGGSPGETGVRMNSLWFKQFSLAPALVTLPLDFTSFNAMLLNNTNNVSLKWTTAAEKNVSHFVVERSTDGKQFTDAGFVLAANTGDNTLYTFTDNNATAHGNILYYRVRSVDADGALKYTATRIIRAAGKQTASTIAILAYPNPVINELRVTIPSNWQDKKVVYEVFNTGGVAVQKIIATNSSQTEALDISKQAPGFYMVKVSCGTETAMQKIIKK